MSLAVAVAAIATLVAIVAIALAAARVRRARERESRSTEDARLAREEARRSRLAVDAARTTQRDFMAAMSHELRTPLNAIAGYASLVRDGVVGPVNELQREQLGRIVLSSRHLADLVGEVLALGRLEAGRDSVSLADVDLAQVIDEAVTVAEPHASARGLSIDVRRPASPVTALTDPEKVRQVLVHLLSNAVRFTSAGGVTIALEPRGTHADLSVADTGAGIAPEHAELVFEPFWQVRREGDVRPDGAGLGLALARRIARLLGGDVRLAASAPGRGSTFVLSLPMVGASSALLERSGDIGGASEGLASLALTETFPAPARPRPAS